LADTVSIIAIRVAEINLFSTYKQPNEMWPHLPAIPYPSVYIENFNSYRTNGRYETNDSNGEIICNWVKSENIQLLFNAKDRIILHSGR